MNCTSGKRIPAIDPNHEMPDAPCGRQLLEVESDGKVTKVCSHCDGPAFRLVRDKTS